MKEFWDQRFQNEEYVYGLLPSDYFGDKLWPRKFGRLLLPGEGEGRNAVFAAKKGWFVHAFDFSRIAAAKAIQFSRKENVRFEYELSDAISFKTAEDFYHLIGIAFIHFMPDQRRLFHEKMIDCLMPGGKIIAEYFSKKQLGMGTGGPGNSEMLYDISQIEKDFHTMNILELKEEKVVLNSGRYHQGEAWVIRMICEKPELLQ